VIEEVQKVWSARGAEADTLSLTWVGSASGMERDIVRRSGIPFLGIGLQGGVRGVGPVAALRGAMGLVIGFVQAMGLVRRLQPEVILATGGYVSVPVVTAGRLLRIPALIYLPDMEPGWAVRFLAPFSSRIAVTAAPSQRFFARDKVVVSGYPVRAEIFGQEQHASRETFGLDPDMRTVLVMGGSRGAHRINMALAGALLRLLPICQIIHITGQQDAGAMRAERDGLPPELRRRYRPYSFLHEDMPKALAAADLIVCRAGASVLGEIPAAGLAAILIPYAGGHRDQEQNAAFLEKSGAAVRIEDARLSAELLGQTITAVLGDPVRLSAMRQASAALAKPDAAAVIASELMTLARA